MNEVVVVYKPQGVTPVQLIEKFREKFPEYEGQKIGFAGRLDPLAHGVMILTVGEANKNREPYLSLNKTYKFSVLFGTETDTYDYLGYLKGNDISDIPLGFIEKIEKFTRESKGILKQPYPPFSSKTLSGVPLFKLAKRNKLKDKDLPIREIEVFKFKFDEAEKVSGLKLKKVILQNLKRIKGYFRQSRIIRQWEKFFEEKEELDFLLAHFEIECSSGTYVRSLAHKLGQQLGCGAIAFEIFRTKVGDFTIDKSIRL